jgi:hypothetical protein
MQRSVERAYQLAQEVRHRQSNAEEQAAAIGSDHRYHIVVGAARTAERASDSAAAACEALFSTANASLAQAYAARLDCSADLSASEFGHIVAALERRALQAQAAGEERPAQQGTDPAPGPGPEPQPDRLTGLAESSTDAGTDTDTAADADTDAGADVVAGVGTDVGAGAASCARLTSDWLDAIGRALRDSRGTQQRGGLGGLGGLGSTAEAAAAAAAAEEEFVLWVRPCLRLHPDQALSLFVDHQARLHASTHDARSCEVEEELFHALAPLLFTRTTIVGDNADAVHEYLSRRRLETPSLSPAPSSSSPLTILLRGTLEHYRVLLQRENQDLVSSVRRSLHLYELQPHWSRWSAQDQEHPSLAASAALALNNHGYCVAQASEEYR